MHSIYIVVQILLIFSTGILLATDASADVYGATNTLLQKFSNNKDYLTNDELNRLVQCSLDVNNCDVSSLSSITGYNPARYLTNCDQNVKYCRAFKECMTVASLIEAITFTYPRVNVNTLPQVLSVIVSQSQLSDCHNSSSDYHTTDATEEDRPSQAEIWGYGILFVTIISVCSLVGVSVLPFMARDVYTTLLSSLIGLAAGSLIASSAFHLIPQAFDLHGLYGNHDYVFPSLNIIIGLWAFLTIERVIKISMHQYGKRSEVKNSLSAQVFLDSNKGVVDGNGYGNSSDSAGGEKESESSVGCCQSALADMSCDCVVGDDGVPSLQTDTFLPKPKKSCAKCNTKDHKHELHGSMCQKDVDLIFASQQQAIKASFGHHQKPKGHSHDHHEAVEYNPGETSVIRTVAWMIIFGDGVHNFLDGVAIGAAFSTSKLTGISVSLAIMCEELPHELGDFAVLLKAGMTLKQALSYNFLSATTCYAGLFLGILLGEFTQDISAVFGLAAGMFLYISCVDMIPEMNEELNTVSENGSAWEICKLMLLQNIGFAIGVFSLFFLAYYQDEIVFE